MSAKAGAFVFGFIAEGIKRIRQRRRAKRAARKAEKDAAGGEFFDDDVEVPVLSGKLTYSSVAALAIVWLAERFGVPVMPEEVESVVVAVVAVGATLSGIYGRWRATKAK